MAAYGEIRVVIEGSDPKDAELRMRKALDIISRALRREGLDAFVIPEGVTDEDELEAELSR